MATASTSTSPFPSDFQTDTGYFAEALAEFNKAHGLQRRFSQLNSSERHCVLERAQWLKSHATPPVPSLEPAKPQTAAWGFYDYFIATALGALMLCVLYAGALDAGWLK